MKSLITGLGLSLILILCTSIQLAINNHGVRQYELTSACNNAMIETQRTFLYTNDIKTQEDYMKCFNTNLSNYIKSDGILSTNFYSADITCGLLDVSVTQQYHSYHQDKLIFVRRTNIVDQLSRSDFLNIRDQKINVLYDIDDRISLDLVDDKKQGNVVFNLDKNKSVTLKIRVLEGDIKEVLMNKQSIPFKIENGFLIVEITSTDTNIVLEIK